jgi:hypothetical protein
VGILRFYFGAGVDGYSVGWSLLLGLIIKTPPPLYVEDGQIFNFSGFYFLF